jgi:hypothetical protein
VKTATRVYGRAICKKRFSHRKTFKDYRWGQVVEFDARIGKDMVITVFIKDQTMDKWHVIVDVVDFVRNFVIEDGAQCSWLKDAENVEGIQRGRVLKACLGMALFFNW